MENINRFIVRLIWIFTVIAIILNIIMIKKVQATTYTQYKKVGISEFPESYQDSLKKLSELHPNWTFTAFYTGMTWDEFISKECSAHGRNSVHKSSDASWKCSCGKIASGYACASKDITQYYADSRNFLTESGIFQFLEMSYNASAQNKAGVESILKGTFMESNVNVSGTSQEIAVKAKMNGSYVMVTPGTKNSEVAEAVEVENYKVTDSKGKTVADSDSAATGNTFTNMKYNTSYTMVVLGDLDGKGTVTASDYMRIKSYIMGETTLNNLQKLAADVDNSGTVMASDYMMIKSYIMNSTPINVTKVTTATGTMSYADIIMKAAEETGISPYSIAIKIIQEVGTKGSSSVSGTYPGYEGYYNFLNIGASDAGNAIENGLKYAKENGWNSPYRSIVEGARFLADSYIGVGQNTAYLYKFDVVSDAKTGTFWHQYMTNVQDPSSQAKKLYNTYAQNNILDASLNFIIPVFNNMPDVCGLPTSINVKDPSSYYIKGTGVRIRSEATTKSDTLGTLSNNEVVTVENINVGSADGYEWAKIKRSNGTSGYVANKYLVKCN